MNKKVLALLCCFVLLMGIVAGCGDNGADKQSNGDTTKLVVGQQQNPMPRFWK